jgi:hypothetical protein
LTHFFGNLNSQDTQFPNLLYPGPISVRLDNPDGFFYKALGGYLDSFVPFAYETGSGFTDPV